MTTFTPFWDLLHAANYDMGPTALRRSEDFFALKIRRLRPGLNPQTRVPEASTLTPRPPNTVGLFMNELNLSQKCMTCVIKRLETA